MTEEEARDWLRRTYDVSRETFDRIEAFIALLREENARQNLVSAASLDRVWSRHIADSAQLVRLAPGPSSRWVDLGTGAGFPGLVVAVLHDGPVTLVEQRRLRIDFLHRASAVLGVEPEIVGGRAERVEGRSFDIVSARAFAPLERIFEIGTRFSTTNSVWLLPKGRNAKSELEAMDSSWQGDFQLKPSLTDPQAGIIVATGVHRLNRKRR